MINVREVSAEEGIVVANSGGRDLNVDVFRPDNASGPLPAVLFLPGGGWRTADRTPLKERYGIRIAQHGYVCVAGEYRVMDEAPWPAQIQDVKRLIRWVRTNSSSLGIDPSKIVIAGKSAGGHLALLAAGTSGVQEFEGTGGDDGVSSELAGVVGVAGVSDMTQVGKRDGMENFWGGVPSKEVVDAASPISYVTNNYPPTLLVHGTSDETVPHAMTIRMYEALEKEGVPVDLVLYAGQIHLFDREPEFSQAISDAIALFVSRYAEVAEPVAAT